MADAPKPSTSHATHVKTEKEEQLVCVICMYGESTTKGNEVILGCGCRFHQLCIQMLFDLAIKSERYYPARCGHRDVFPVEGNIIDAVGGETIEKYENKQAEYSCVDRLYCCNKSCRAFIPPAARSNGLGRCVEKDCHGVTCTSCGKENHMDECVKDPNEIALERLVSERGWQRCRNCGRVWDLRSGCNDVE
ncbi:hypothetical protein F4677DRAFT_451434 [Hypoxylon crocopeplum]|nr:hypothetical protein F4677DRAFT_451434 [Hypoxylon crocopeplum]